MSASSPTLAPVETKTFELPQPKSLLAPREREVREQPVSAYGRAAGTGRFVPGKDGRLYKGGNAASSPGARSVP